MPAPAPCASTKHVFAAVGRCINPDTRICWLTEIVTDCGMEDATPPVCTETQGRRDSVSVGTDDDAPALRLAVVLLCAAALTAAALTGYTHWTASDREFRKDSRQVVQVAAGMAEAMASFTPSAPTSSIDRAAAMMVPEQAGAFKEQYKKTSADLAQRSVTAQAATLSAGVEAIGPSAASVAVILRVTQNTPGQPPSRAAPALRVALVKRGGDWLVSDVLPINSR